MFFKLGMFSTHKMSRLRGISFWKFIGSFWHGGVHYHVRGSLSNSYYLDLCLALCVSERVFLVPCVMFPDIYVFPCLLLAFTVCILCVPLSVSSCLYFCVSVQFPVQLPVRMPFSMLLFFFCLVLCFHSCFFVWLSLNVCVCVIPCFSFFARLFVSEWFDNRKWKVFVWINNPERESNICTELGSESFSKRKDSSRAWRFWDRMNQESSQLKPLGVISIGTSLDLIYVDLRAI